MSREAIARWSAVSQAAATDGAGLRRRLPGQCQRILVCRPSRQGKDLPWSLPGGAIFKELWG
eukprot:6483084-Alexandrium_andersonii.AAC.1